MHTYIHLLKSLPRLPKSNRSFYYGQLLILSQPKSPRNKASLSEVGGLQGTEADVIPNQYY